MINFKFIIINNVINIVNINEIIKILIIVIKKRFRIFFLNIYINFLYKL